MRVIAGTYRGRSLKSIDAPGLRPTTDRVRESIFNIVASRIDLEGASVLDLFAGTGALGIEALSRGATSCDFVERDRRTADTIQANLETFGASSEGSVHRGDAIAFLRKASRPYRLVVADPPYRATLFDELLSLVFSQQQKLLEPGGIFVLEHSSAMRPGTDPRYPSALERSFGDTAITLYQG